MYKKPCATGLALTIAIFSGSLYAHKAPWQPPTDHPFAISRPFAIPHGPFNAGHRGIDISAQIGDRIVAPTDATVIFSGIVVDRPVLSIETTLGIRISFEPLASSLTSGSAVLRGTPIGTVAEGGHCDHDCTHIGVRINGRYTNPARWFKAKPVLLPLLKTVEGQ